MFDRANVCIRENVPYRRPTIWGRRLELREGLQQAASLLHHEYKPAYRPAKLKLFIKQS